MSDITPHRRLLAAVPDDAVTALAGFYRERRAEPGRGGQPLTELLTFAALVDAPATCARLTARLLSCLVPQHSVLHPDGEPVAELYQRLCRYLPADDPAVAGRARMVLAAALGMLIEVPDPLAGGRPGEPDPSWIEAAAAALHVGLDYVTGCFGIPGLTAAEVLAEAAAA